MERSGAPGHSPSVNVHTSLVQSHLLSGLSYPQQSESCEQGLLPATQHTVSPAAFPLPEHDWRSSQQFDGLLPELHPVRPDSMHAFCSHFASSHVAFEPHALPSMTRAPFSIEHVLTVFPSHFG